MSICAWWSRVARILTKHALLSVWHRRVVVPPESLVPGTYKPDATTTGVVSTNLPVYNDPATQSLIITQDNLVLQNLTIYGDIKIRARGVTIRGCVLRGGDYIPSGNTGVVDCNSSSCFDAVIEDCLIDPIKPSYYRDGIVGHEYTARRNHVRYTNDGFGAFITTAIGTQCNVTIEANYVHDLTYWYPDPAHTDGTHNDCLQIQGGANIHVIGNNFVGFSVKGAGSGNNPDKPRLLSESPKMINGSCVIVQKQSTTAALVNVVIEKNWLNGGLAGMNMKPGSYTVRDNKFGRDWYDYNPNGNPSMFPIRGDSYTSTSATGLYDSNRWEDTGGLMAGVVNGGTRHDGIRWNDIAD